MMMISTTTFLWRRIGLVLTSALLTVGFLLVLLLSTIGFDHQQQQTVKQPLTDPIPKSSNQIQHPSATLHRKLLSHNTHRGRAKVKPNRVWGDKCTTSDIVVTQGPTTPLPNGIPTFTVEIMNLCSTGCDISNIHLSCGWFSSARMINPKVFKRVRFDDCVVNNGGTLVNGGTLSFHYANTFKYPLSVSHVKC